MKNKKVKAKLVLILSTNTNQETVTPLSCLSLLIRVHVGVRVRVRPIHMYPLRSCCYAACPCPGRNCDFRPPCNYCHRPHPFLPLVMGL